MQVPTWKHLCSLTDDLTSIESMEHLERLLQQHFQSNRESKQSFDDSIAHKTLSKNLLNIIGKGNKTESLL